MAKLEYEKYNLPNTDLMQWSDIESSSKSSIQEKKIRVSFLPAAGSEKSSSATAGTGGVASTPRKGGLDADDAPPAYSSPVSNAATPAGKSSAPATGPVSRPESRPADAKSLGDAVNSAGIPSGHEKGGMMGAAAGAASGVAATASKNLPSSSDDVKAQLENANAQILRLKEQLQDQSGLRQRKGDSGASEKDSATSQAVNAMQNSPGGVSVPIVAALCLVSFLLAYLLF